MVQVVLMAAAILAFAVAAVVLYALTRPRTFHVARAAFIDAPPDSIHAILTDLRRGAEWSPYEKKDPQMKTSFEGPPTGPGAVMHWDGNRDVGAGSLTIADASPHRIALKLDMTRPMRAHNIVEYTLAPRGGGTDLTWAVHGPMNPLSRVMCLVLDMDKMIGRDLEQGLRDLKALAER
jgi:hypothetical protein